MWKRGFYAAKVLSVAIHKKACLNEGVRVWTKFNDYPVARSTLGDIPVEAGEHLTLYLYRHGDEIVLWYSLLASLH